MYTALNAASETLRQFLSERLASDPDLASFFSTTLGGAFDVFLCSPREMPERSGHGLTVWLYQVVRDEQRLNAPPRRIDYDRIEHPPLPLCLHYLVTPMVEVAEGGNESTLEQLVLGKVLQVLHDHPTLRGVDLRGDFGGRNLELNVRLEPLELDRLTRVWEALGSSYQLSVSYEVSVVEIESELEAEQISPVDVVLPELGIILSARRDPGGRP
jgi:hypothetical protein